MVVAEEFAGKEGSDLAKVVTGLPPRGGWRLSKSFTMTKTNTRLKHYSDNAKDMNTKTNTRLKLYNGNAKDKYPIKALQ